MFRLTSSFFSLLAVGAAATANARLLSSHSCDLECPLNAPCRFGEADFSERTGLVAAGEATHQNGMHCDCPIGWTGILCDKKYETCTNQKGHECYNGGECILGLEDKYGNEQLFCDCSKARGFVGKYCETPFVQRCGEDEVACVNGGACNPEYPFASSEPCICDKDWEGRHCQIKKENGKNDDGSFLSTTNYESNPPCDGGYCLNGGSCIQEQKVVQDGFGTSTIDEYCDCSQTYDGESYFAGVYCQYKSTNVCLVQNAPLGTSEPAFCVHHGDCKTDGSCACPHGWAGEHCEFKTLDVDQGEGGTGEIYMDEETHFAAVDKCGNSICYNGGKCIETQRFQPNGGIAIESHCDCSIAFDEKYMYAGSSCEFPHTQVCWIPREGDDTSAAIFCTNHGSCRDTPELGCDCPSGFSGPACEYEIHGANSSKGGNRGGEVCGNGICHNGGKCVTSTIYNEVTGVSKTSYQCDCSSAYDDEVAYLGESCEYPATDICTPAKAGEPLSSAKFCVNHGSCNRDSSKDCECGSGFEGKSCELKIGFDAFDQGSGDNEDIEGEEVVEEFDLCGDADGLVFPCFNGGTCTTNTQTDENGNTFELGKYCHCNSASSGTNLFAGFSCEYRATSICNNSFCVNGGTCQQNGVCDCPVPWKGIHCEMPMDEKDLLHGILGVSVNDPKSDTECNLECMNGGVCVPGPKDLDRFANSVKNVAHLNQMYADDQFAHCACPDGWIGLTCENKLEVCGDDQHFCLHGSTCISDTGSVDQGYGCDCSQADDSIDGDSKTHIFTGDSCQYVDTDICTIGDEYPGRPLYFCVNGGRCNGKVTADKPDPGCTCPNGYTGPSCEVKLSMGARGLGLIAGLLVALVVVLAVVATYIRKLLLRGRKNADVSIPATVDIDVPATKTTLSPRRRRKNGFGKSARRKQPSVSFSNEGRVDENEGVMKDCSLDDDESPYENDHEMVDFSSADDDVDIKIRGTHFV